MDRLELINLLNDGCYIVKCNAHYTLWDKSNQFSRIHPNVFNSINKRGFLKEHIKGPDSSVFYINKKESEYIDQQKEDQKNTIDLLSYKLKKMEKFVQKFISITEFISLSNNDFDSWVISRKDYRKLSNLKKEVKIFMDK